MPAATSWLRMLVPALLPGTATACASDPVGIGSSSSSLDAPTLFAVCAALQDENHASAMYSAVMSRFGGTPPFLDIERAERQHAASLAGALAALLSFRGIPVPDAEPLAGTPVFTSVAAACVREQPPSESRESPTGVSTLWSGHVSLAAIICTSS